MKKQNVSFVCRESLHWPTLHSRRYHLTTICRSSCSRPIRAAIHWHCSMDICAEMWLQSALLLAFLWCDERVTGSLELCKTLLKPLPHRMWCEWAGSRTEEWMWEEWRWDSWDTVPDINNNSARVTNIHHCPQITVMNLNLFCLLGICKIYNVYSNFPDAIPRSLILWFKNFFTSHWNIHDCIDFYDKFYPTIECSLVLFQ